MSASLFEQRAQATGAVGSYLSSIVSVDLANIVASVPYDKQISFVYSPVWAGRRPSGLQRIAGAFLFPKFPVQVSVTDGDLIQLLTACVSLPRPTEHHLPFRWSTMRQYVEPSFPLKNNNAASNKVNVYLREIMTSLYDYSLSWGVEAERALSASIGKLSDDQATALVLYGTALRSKGVQDAYLVSCALLLDPGLGKDLTSVLKAVGANANHLGAVLVETQTLQGRGVAPADLAEECRQRTTDAVNDSVVDYSEETLREHIRYVLQREIRREHDSLEIQFPTLEEHWASRWAWAVNGSQSGLIKARKLEAAPRPPGAAREYRRSWLERVEQDPRPSWDGTTFVSASPKLEQGKTRAIFACDTQNYLAFEHLLASVEKRWRGERVVLNPGRGGNVGMSFRVTSAKQRAGINMMLDFDNFNDHHSTLAMKILFEELCNITGYDPSLRDKLLTSFDKMYVYLGARRAGRVLGTLMSGHRGTTFINSVLNEVYLAIELGRQWLDDRPSIHVGDDVYLGVRTYSDASYVTERVSSSRLRMNPMKQSVGHVSTEFLRLACAGRATYGYLARSVASTISGNWVSEESLDPYEGLTSMLTNARSLANRAAAPFLPLLLRHSVYRITKLGRRDHRKLDGLLAGQIALDNGPLFSPGATYDWVEVGTLAPSVDQWGYHNLPLYSTRQYLSRCARPLEVRYLTEAGVSLTGVMAEASYRKTYASDFASCDRITLSQVKRTPVSGSAAVEQLMNVRPPEGVLSQYPLLHLARRRLPTIVVKRAVKDAGGNPEAQDLDLEAWGEYKHGCIVAVPMGYADAAMYGRRTHCGVLTCGLHFYI